MISDWEIHNECEILIIFAWKIRNKCNATAKETMKNIWVNKSDSVSQLCGMCNTPLGDHFDT